MLYRLSGIFLPLMLIVFIMSTGCSSNQDYESLVRDGIESGERVDSLLLGYHFGMTREEFRDTSFAMNKQGIMTGFVEIEYPFHELKDEALMKFYPEFQDNKIVRIPISVEYTKWAPWNEEYWPEELMIDLKEHYEEEYETTFHQVYFPDIEEPGYVSIEGNREIRIYRDSESTAGLDFRDLTVFNPLEEEE